MRVIIPAAGKGSRLSKSPDAPPKVMYRIGGKPLLEIVLEQTSFIAPEDTWLVVGYKQEEVRSYFGNSMHYTVQKEQLGTGHAVMMCAEDFRDYDGTVLVTFGDMPLFRGECMKAMCAFHESKHAACTLLTARNPELTMWARIVTDEKGRFREIVEGKDCTPEQAKIPELCAGVFVFDSRLLFRYLPKLSDANVQHEYYLTEVPALMAADGLPVLTFPTENKDDLRGINTPEDVVVCEKILRARGIL